MGLSGGAGGAAGCQTSGMEDVTRVPEDEASAIGRRGFGRMLLAAGAAVTLPLLAGCPGGGDDDDDGDDDD
ncbi:hypothetical protein GCM10023107_87440 [Actinoplanes octamycinicus]|nr:hypothetical protein Aoc01nite_79530 [Actinoplanes octamycinicus]